MKFIYKTVSLAQFLKDNKDARIGMGTRGDQVGLSNQASMAVERLLNHYAREGWEYVKSEEFYSDFFKSTALSIFEGLIDSNVNNNPRLQMFIFRQPFTEEMEKRLAEEEKLALEALRLAQENTNKPAPTKMPEITDARCPNCESLVNKLDARCWKCDASFGELSAWRPIPL
jgi:hypothetical protein